MDELCDDLTAEHDDLDRMVDGADLSTPDAGRRMDGRRPAQPPLVLRSAGTARVDRARGVRSRRRRDPRRRVRRRRGSIGRRRAVRCRPAELLERWREDRRRLVDHARTVDPRARVPWYGPAMGARSFITARLMETWAHGQDVADALGVERTPTDRLRHVAHIGVGARAFSYLANGREPSQAPVRVELVAPSGDTWSWGPEDAADRVTGPALGFCLLVTQRRHRDDVGLDCRGRGRRRVARHRPVVRRPAR